MWTPVAAAMALPLVGSAVVAGDAQVLPPVTQRYAPAEVTEEPSFQRHVSPLFGRLGCNGRSCHGSFQGRGGFRLSLFGYDFHADHAELLKGEPLRANKDKPLDSLIIAKPTDADMHEGGERYKKGGWEYNIFRRWIEAGTKYALLKGQLFLNLAYFQQSRTAKTTSSTSIVEYKTKGVEFELNYQPNKHLYSTLSYSYIDAKTAGFQFQYGMFGGTSELTGGEAITFAPETRTSGVPRSSFNGLISYSLDNGWGFTANTLVTSPINNNVAATIVIPWQFEIDAGVTYKYSKKWDYRLSIGNVTNEKNWAPPNAVYGNGSILALAGTTFSFNAKYSF